MKRLALLAVSCVVLTSCSGASGTSERPPVPEATPSMSGSWTPALPATSPTPRAHVDFSVTITTDQSNYNGGEAVGFTVEICNQGPPTTTEGYGGTDIPFSYRILDEADGVVADDSHAFRTLELRTVQWSEHQCRTARMSWDQRFWNRPEDEPSEPPEVYGTPVRGDEVPTGRYRIRISSSLGTATSAAFELSRPD